MRTSDAIKKIAKNFPSQVQNQEAFKRLEQFDTQMKHLGIIRETTYGLPLTDMFSGDARTKALFAGENALAYNTFNP
jgi:hypothetical protein